MAQSPAQLLHVIGPGQISPSARIKPIIVGMDAVLEAADEWVSAQEALLGATASSEERETRQEAADIAGARLVVAVKRWRAGLDIAS
jgi:hypothetical protein